jgi:hypothetical protein
MGKIKKTASDSAASNARLKIDDLDKKSKAAPAITPVTIPSPAAVAAPGPASIPPPAPAGVKPLAAAVRKAPVRRTGTAAAKKTTKSAKQTILPSISTDDIALRAYFISEKRHAHGLPGDEHQDWIEAERQLQAEAAGRARRKKKGV